VISYLIFYYWNEMGQEECDGAGEDTRECDGAGEDTRECDGKDVIFLTVNKDSNRTLETIILGLIIIVIFLVSRETGKQVTSSCAQTIIL
jgi:hypothetical protein